MSIGQRIAISALSLTAAGLIGLVAKESFVGTAMIPTKNDRPTVGFGSTFRDDGTPVQMGDKITVVQALKRTQAHIAKDEIGLKKCVTADLHTAEYDEMVDHGYQYGIGATCNSPMVREANAGNYAQACEGYLEYKYLTSPNKTAGWTAFKFDAAGRPVRWRFDCSTPGNRVCAGVWTRSLERRNKCMAVQ